MKYTWKRASRARGLERHASDDNYRPWHLYLKRERVGQLDNPDQRIGVLRGSGIPGWVARIYSPKNLCLKRHFADGEIETAKEALVDLHERALRGEV